MMRLLSRTGALVALLSLSAAPSWGGPANLSVPAKAYASDALIPVSKPALAPFAYILFCRDHPDECATSHSGPVAVDASRLPLLKRINTDVNRRMRPRPDVGEEWSVGTASGDCEDYALTKRSRLLAAGFPREALRLAVVLTPDNQGHAVLVVRSSEGELVLDNLSDSVRVWHRTRLTWVKIASAENPRLWYSVAR